MSIHNLATDAAQRLRKPELTAQLAATMDKLRRHESLRALPPGCGISFVTTCFRRGWQLEQALPINLIEAAVCPPEVRFFVLVMGHDAEGDRLVAWLQNHLGAAIADGRLSVARCEAASWHASVAKNTCIKVAIMERPDIQEHKHFIINVDGDNVFSSAFVMSVMEEARKGEPHYFRVWRGDDGGTTGRNGFYASVFRELSGYDESLLPSGFQEVDLWRRAGKMPNHSMRKLSVCCGFSIPN